MAIMDQLPKAPPWLSQDITIPEAPGQTQTLLYRDPVACIRYLFGNPLFRGYMHYDAVHHTSMDDDEVRIYNEMNSGTDWEQVQVKCV
jgi:hypothetical protein